jgi:hypothetical protein
MRVISERQKISSDRDSLEKKADFAILGMNAM